MTQPTPGLAAKIEEIARQYSCDHAGFDLILAELSATAQSSKVAHADKTGTIVAFLFERIDEDEAEALATRGVGLVPDFPDGAWTERRVLAECEAKRQIIAACYGDDPTQLEFDPQFDDERVPALVLRALAAPYADHPDFDAGWAV